jgi:hypothetical protein
MPDNRAWTDRTDIFPSVQYWPGRETLKVFPEVLLKEIKKRRRRNVGSRKKGRTQKTRSSGQRV